MPEFAEGELVKVVRTPLDPAFIGSGIQIGNIGTVINTELYEDNWGNTVWVSIHDGGGRWCFNPRDLKKYKKLVIGVYRRSE